VVQYRPHVQLWYDMLGHMLCDVRVCTFDCLAEVTALRPCFIHCDFKKWTVVIFSITPSNSSPYYTIRGRQPGAEAAFRPNMLPLVHQLVIGLWIPRMELQSTADIINCSRAPAKKM